MSIFVYSGDGTQRVDELYDSLKDGLKQLKINHDVKLIYADDIQSCLSQPSAKLVVLPGGRDMPYVRDISEDAIDCINEFISNGGSFLGLCAGAYFSCSYVSFEEGTPLEVKGHRKLKLFKGTGKGSVYPGFMYNSTKGSRVATLQCEGKLKESLGMTSYAYFNGGCEFIPDNEQTNYVTLATYHDTTSKKAIVEIPGSKGKAILSGVHPEMDVEYLKATEYTSGQWEDMNKYNTEQRKLFVCCLKYLLE